MEKKRLMVIGAGGVGTVVVKKCARMADIYEEILLASRTRSKCDAIAADSGPVPVRTAEVDADSVDDLIRLINRFNPNLLINVALPYQDISIMEACLQTGVHYLDTANYEPKDKAEFEYSWQWAYHDRYVKAGLTALLGSGFDPGVTNVFTAYAAKHYFDEIHYLDIVDCNAGSHGLPFATNFNPEINIREITQPGRYYKDGQWIKTKPLEISKDIDYPRIGPKPSYLLFHEELESLVKHFPTIKQARFWMTFSQQYITYLQVLQDVGMTAIKPVEFQGMQIQPLQFLKAVLPEPASLGENYQGETSIGCQIRGIKYGKERTCYIFNNCNHQSAYHDTKSQAVSYTTGVPAAISARLITQGVYQKTWCLEHGAVRPRSVYGIAWSPGATVGIIIDGQLAFEKPEA